MDALDTNYLMPDCTCVPVPLRDLFGFADVKAPVGELGSRRGNLSDDVRLVQFLLNETSVDQGGQGQPPDGRGLKEDGRCGPLTKAAIKRFQAQQFPEYAPDGLVEPGKQTINALNFTAFPSGDDLLQAEGIAAITVAASYVAAGLFALRNLRTRGFLPNPLFGPGREERIANYHFHLDQSTDASRDLNTLIGTFITMQTVLAHQPMGPNHKPAFGFLHTMPHNKHRHDQSVPLAFTQGGGYQYLQGKDENFLRAKLGLPQIDSRFSIPVDQIYLTRRLFTVSPSTIPYAIVHETAHFVGGVAGDIDFIGDRQYFHRSQARYEKLDTYEAMTNADCYAQFCWELVHDTHFRP